MTKEITAKLFELQDEKYREFQCKLVPEISGEFIIGVRVPQVRKLAKQLYKEGQYKEFLSDLPHKYYDENILHGQILNQIKDYDECMMRVEEFLPFIDNWAVCDLISPKVFLKDKSQLIEKLKEWAQSSHLYTSRLGLELIMSFFLKEDFKPEYLELAASQFIDQYYHKMMIAWFMATALAFQWDFAIVYLEEKCLDKWIHNKTIQKAVESYRISDEKKVYLKSIKQ